jgi:probable HAF family extracellular repeat protein
LSVAVSVLAGAIAVVFPGAAHGEYAVIDLGVLTNTASGHSASVAAVNATGQVSMTNAPLGTAYQAFRFSGGSASGLGTLGGTDSFGAGINMSGQLVGRSLTSTGASHAFVWTPGGTNGVASNPQMKDLNPTGGTSAATSINSTGQVAGYMTVSRPQQPDQDRAVIYSNGTITQIPLPTGGFFYSYAYGINDNGKVAGEAYTALSPISHGFVYNGATTSEIGDLGGASSTPLAINNNDRIVGYSSTPEGYDHAFVYSGGTMSDLGTLGGHYSYANAINNKNVIVGSSFTDDLDSIFHAFITDGTSLTDLNSKVTSKAADWVLSEASGINDTGVIVGVGTLSGAKHGYMLKPLTPGDANADLKVDFTDLVTLAQHYNTQGGATWETGDFNGDGNVDFADLVALAQNYNSVQAGDFTTDVQAAFASAPEPGSCFVCLGALFWTRRRRRRAFLR